MVTITLPADDDDASRYQLRLSAEEELRDPLEREEAERTLPLSFVESDDGEG